MQRIQQQQQQKETKSNIQKCLCNYWLYKHSFKIFPLKPSEIANKLQNLFCIGKKFIGSAYNKYTGLDKEADQKEERM